MALEKKKEIRNKRLRKPILALIYDFDGTLSPTNMQEYGFMKEIGIENVKDFWKENTEMQHKHNASNILCYMKLMIDKSKAAKKSIKRKQFQDYGKSIELFNGVQKWFDKINKVGKDNGVKIEHYINSSGLQEMIEGTPIAGKFKKIFACRFMYDENDVAVWPAVAVDFTAKTQFLFMINKGIENIYDNNLVNKFVREEDRLIPFSRMVYFGDGETDVPCMRLVKEKGGNSIAVYKPHNSRKRSCAQKLVNDKRVNFACAADYSEDSEIYNIVSTIIKQVRNDFDFQKLENDNQKKFEPKRK